MSFNYDNCTEIRMLIINSVACTVELSFLTEDILELIIRHNFRVQIFHGFGLGSENHEGLISRFSDVFITINRHKLKWKFS